MTGGGPAGARYGFPVPRIPLTAALAAVLAVAVPAVAMADVYDDYRRDGQINPCRYSDRQLKNGLNGLPPDIRQYSPGLADQLSAGREGCGGSAPGSAPDTRQRQSVPVPVPVPGAGSGGGPAGADHVRVPAPPAPSPARRDRLAALATPSESARLGSHVPGWLGIVLGGLALAGAAAAAVRLGGFGPGRLPRRLGASFADAGGRTADAFAELWDSVRLGR